MKRIVKLVAILFATLVLLGAGTYGWASFETARTLSRTIEIHSVDFPIPFPLSEEDRVAMGLDEVGAQRVALEQAIERGDHLVRSRYVCVECHGADFSGGVMVDAAPMGRLLGPNLTLGAGSVTAQYGPADWDRIVRHGVRANGTPATMPSEDFQLMTDQELSDVVAYLRAQPPVDNVVPPVAFGPLGKLLIATGKLPLSVDLIEAHGKAHGVYPPITEVSADFGRHLAGVCTGCHRQNLAGGPIVGGDPSWPAARNLTPHEEGLAGWTYENFVRAMREGARPDGTPVLEPMSFMAPYAQRMTEVELQALWTYLQSIPPAATPN